VVKHEIFFTYSLLSFLHAYWEDKHNEKLCQIASLIAWCKPCLFVN